MDREWQALEHIATLVAVLRLDGAAARVNAALENALGVSRKSILGHYFGGFFQDDELIHKALVDARAQRFSSLRFEAQLRRSLQDSFPVHANLSWWEEEESILVELWPLEQQVRQDREERVREQALANKELIRNLAHEIKNPLGGIRGAAQLLELELPDAQLKEYTDVIIHEADRLQALVDRLLAPHRHPHTVGDVNIHEVCERVCQLVLLEYPQGLRIERDYDTSLPEIRGDREQLIQALLNIVQNAAQVLVPQMAQDNARITLRTRIARQLTLGRKRHKLALELHVIDNGPGIEPDIKERIFYPLVTGRDGGTGLGLPLAQTFVQRHEGLIECESEPGRTDFRIMLPLTD
jgi:two-component system nitrogen regulation sensor histidine kinase GlnL